MNGPTKTDLVNPLAIIRTIRESFPGAIDMYSNGGCWEFHKILKAIWHDAEPWYDGGHVITKIYSQFYDITGLRTCTTDHALFTPEDQWRAKADSWKYEIEKGEGE